MNRLWALLWGLGKAIGSALVVSILCWTLVECAPGNVATRAALAGRVIAPGDAQMNSQTRKRLVDQVAERYGLQESFAKRTWDHSLELLRGDFGVSWRDGSSITDTLVSKASLITLLLCFSALVLATLVGCLGAIASARHRQSLADKSWGVFSALAISIPLPWLAMLTAESLSYGHPFSFASVGGDGMRTLVLPILLLAIAPLAVVWNHMREELVMQSEKPWVAAARARGISERRIWGIGLPRISLWAVLSLLPALLAYLFAASILVERVFVIPGLGEVVASAALHNDAPVLVAIAAVTAFFVSITSFAAGGLGKALDPRRNSNGPN